MTATPTAPPYPPADESGKKLYYWPEYVELTGADAFTTDYRDQLADREGPVGFHVLGRCPRCTCLTGDVFPLAFVGTGSVGRATASYTTRGGLESAQERAGAAGGAPAPVPVSVPAEEFYGLLSCRCPTVHFPPPGAPDNSKPEDAIGCGTYWMATATLDRVRKQMTIGPAGTEVSARVWSAAKAVGQSTSVALARVQANASKWQTSMTAVLGLLVVTGLVGGRTVLETLGALSRLLIGLFAGISLLTNVWSIFLLTSAASGRTRLLPSGSRPQLEAADLEPLRQARTAERQFGHGLVLVVISFCTALIALLLVWFLPSAASPTVDVTIEVGAAPRTTCGAISVDPSGGTFTVTPRNLSDSPQTYPIAQLSGIGAPC